MKILFTDSRGDTFRKRERERESETDEQIARLTDMTKLTGVISNLRVMKAPKNRNENYQSSNHFSVKQSTCFMYVCTFFSLLVSSFVSFFALLFCPYFILSLPPFVISFPLSFFLPCFILCFYYYFSFRVFLSHTGFNAEASLTPYFFLSSWHEASSIRDSSGSIVTNVRDGQPKIKWHVFLAVARLVSLPHCPDQPLNPSCSLPSG